MEFLEDKFEVGDFLVLQSMRLTPKPFPITNKTANCVCAVDDSGKERAVNPFYAIILKRDGTYLLGGAYK